MKQSLSFVLVVLSFVVFSCGGSPAASSQEAAAVDSFLLRHVDSLYASPARADSAFAVMQSAVADSANYHRLGLFRALARHMLGDTAAVRHIHDEVEDWCRRHAGTEALEALLWDHRGTMAAGRGRFDTACGYFAQAYSLLSRTADRDYLPDVCVHMADARFWDGDMPEAAAYYHRALFVADSLCSTVDYFAIYTGLGQVYAELENFKEAHLFFAKARPLLPAVPRYDVFRYYLSLGNCYYYEQANDSALAAFAEGLRVARSLGSPSLVMQAEAALGEVSLLSGRVAEAGDYIRRCAQYVREHPETDPSTVFHVNSLSADIALAEGRLSDAGQFLSCEPDTALIAPRYLSLHYARLQRYAELCHDYRLAYRYQTLAQQYADSFRNRQAANNVVEWEFRYVQDTTLLRQRIALADYAAHASRQQVYIVVVVALLVVLVLAAVGAGVAMRRRAERRYRRQLDRVTQLRMDVVRNRVSPHYIFNVLGAVLPRFRAYPELTRPLELLVDVLRGNLLASGKMSVRLDEEITLVRRYVALCQLVSGDRPAVRWDVEDGLPGDVRVPTMCLQIPVENAMKHAFPNPDAASAIDIRIARAEGGISLTVVDNGVGYRPGRITPTGRDTRTGLRVLSQTIDLLNAHNAQAARFTLHNREAPQTGTVVSFFVPTGYRFPGDEA